MKLYMSRTVPLSIIRSLFTVHSALVYVIQVCRRLSSSNICSCSCIRVASLILKLSTKLRWVVNFTLRPPYPQETTPLPTIVYNTDSELYCRREAGAAGTNYRSPAVRKGAGARLSYTCLCLSRKYHYLPTVPINPFRPDSSRCATDSQSFRFSAKSFVVGPPLLGVAEKNLTGAC